MVKKTDSKTSGGHILSLPLLHLCCCKNVISLSVEWKEWKWSLCLFTGAIMRIVFFPHTQSLGYVEIDDLWLQPLQMTGRCKKYKYPLLLIGTIWWWLTLGSSPWDRGLEPKLPSLELVDTVYSLGLLLLLALFPHFHSGIFSRYFLINYFHTDPSFKICFWGTQLRTISIFLESSLPAI